jgi:hypothetical protein
VTRGDLIADLAFEIMWGGIAPIHTFAIDSSCEFGFSMALPIWFESSFESKNEIPIVKTEVGSLCWATRQRF